VEANVDRWIAQLAPESGSAKPARRVESVNGFRVTTLQEIECAATGMPVVSKFRLCAGIE
jgi:hypothetical protein